MATLALRSAAVSRPALWTARLIASLVVLFLLVDAVTKLLEVQPVVQAFVREGIRVSLAPQIGAILLALVVLYLIPRLQIFAAVLLTGYLGGAVAVNLIAGDPPFEVLFPVIMGVLVWGPPYLLNDRVREVIPLRSVLR